MWTDNETTLDLIGFKVHSDLIKSIVIDQSLLPITMGLFGDWGGGKTSIMKMLKEDLDASDDILCLYFNGWLFEGYDDAKSAIISSILLQLGEHKQFGPKVRDKVVSLLKSVNWMRLARFGFKEIAIPAITAYVTGGASIIPGLAENAKNLFSQNKKNEEQNDCNEDQIGAENINWEDLIKKDDTPSSPLDIRSFRERFSSMIKESEIKSLVILIDDLDRCSPERIIENLEAIKLFLNVDQTAFVIGADPRIIKHAITNRYRFEFNQENQRYSYEGFTNDYLEKLIQVPYYLPKLSPSEIETYIALLFCTKDLEDKQYLQIIEKSRNKKENNRYSTFGYGDIQEILKEDMSAHLNENLSICSCIAPLITEGLKGNPRQVKRFLNAFVVRKKLAKVAGLQYIKDDVLAKLMVLEYTFPTQFNSLFEWQTEYEGFPKQLQLIEAKINSEDTITREEIDNITNKSGWGTQFMIKWFTMKPYLSDIDLRDYFWIARDKLHSTFSNLSMIPPYIRQLFEDLIDGNPLKNAIVIQSIKEISESDIQTLLKLLEQQTIRLPKEISGYNAIKTLIYEDISGSVELYIKVLEANKHQEIPFAVAIDLLTISNKNDHLKNILEPIISSLECSNTKIGNVIKKKRGRK